MIPVQRHNSDPFVCHVNLPINESTVCFRRASASLVEMLRCRTHSPSPCMCPSQCVASTNSKENSDHLSSNAAQNPPLLSPLLPPNQHSHHDSASHFNSPLLPLNLQPPSELCLSVPHSPHHLCKACMSLLLGDRTKGCRSLGHTRIQSFSPSPHFNSSPRSSTSSPVTLPPLLASTSLNPLSKSQTNLVTSPSHLSPPSQVVFPRSLYEGGDLTLLNQCLQHIVSRRISSPTLSANHPMHSHREVGVNTSSVVGHMDKRHSLDVPLFSSPNMDRNPLFSPHDSQGRPDQLVG